MVLRNLHGDIACSPMHSGRETGLGEIWRILGGVLQTGALATCAGHMVMPSEDSIAIFLLEYSYPHV